MTLLRSPFVLVLVAAAAFAPRPSAQFPPVPVPAANPMTPDKVNLGKALFWDEQLSSTRTVACGTCHQPRAGGGDPRAAFSVNPGPDLTFGTPDDVRGSFGVPLRTAAGTYVKSLFGLDVQVTGRNSPSAINAAFNNEQFWDGREAGVFNDPLTGANVLPSRGSLENQAKGPPASDVEMAHQGRDWQQAADQIAAAKPLALATNIPPALQAWIGTKSYPELFQLVFGDPAVTPARILLAIATYERTLISDQSPLDRFNIGQTNALSPLEKMGLDVFTGVGRCNICHDGPLLRNGNYANIGVRPIAEDPGRFKVTNDPRDLGKFKVPDLHNVGLRTRFFHNGGAASLAEVVEFYDRGGDFDENKDPAMGPLFLTDQEKQALVAFLQTGLTDPRVAAELPPFDRPTLYSESNLVPLTYGPGSPGSGVPVPYVPRLIAIEPPMLGNPSMSIALTDARGGVGAAILFDLAPGAMSVLGLPLNLAMSPALMALPLGTLPGSGYGEGHWSGAFAISTDPSLDGVSIYMQAFTADFGAPLGLAASPGVELKLFAPH
jgi:cytochrome c peroxidase